MKITIENYGKTMFIDLGHDDVLADEFVKTIAGIMILMGFHTETIKKTLSSYGEELN